MTCSPGKENTMLNTILTIGVIVLFFFWGVAGAYVAYTTIRDDRRKELKLKMEEKEELERKIRSQIRDEYWLEEQSRKLRQEELKKRFEKLSE